MPLNRIVRTYGRRAERKALESAARSKARQQFQIEAMDDTCPSSRTDGKLHPQQSERGEAAGEGVKPRSL